jgi:hypothetical protein
LAFYDEAGHGQAALAVSSDGPMLSFFNTRGIEVAKLSTIADLPFLMLADQAGNKRVQVGINDDAPHIVLYNIAGKPSVGMGVDREGPLITLNDLTGTVRGRLTANSRETKLAFADDQADRLVLSLSAEASGIQLFDRSRILRGAFTSKTDGTVLSMSDSTGKIRALMGEAQAGAQLTFFNQNGKIVATVPR